MLQHGDNRQREIRPVHSTRRHRDTPGGQGPQEGRGERYRKSHSSGVSCGRYKFSNISKAPYDTSQHGDLVAAGGWYLFWLERFGVVGALFHPHR
ncbi:MAG: hypothetical protein PHU95_00635 [Candidatus Thermoplasmatota archaeon]|nr:hypothetical protein [Candidatus Thermoplasmatota archaeon]MDD5777943.1 hypothetical protein [Candidatus Thermoplasmatota archaeon]